MMGVGRVQPRAGRHRGGEGGASRRPTRTFRVRLEQERRVPPAALDRAAQRAARRRAAVPSGGGRPRADRGAPRGRDGRRPGSAPRPTATFPDRRLRLRCRRHEPRAPAIAGPRARPRRVAGEAASESPARPPSYRDAQSRAGGTFRLVTDFTPQGDQAQAIESSSKGCGGDRRDQVLLGVTGSGKTFTIAKVDRGGQPADARALAQQDARRAALPGVPRVLPRERGRVLRLVLRLLPARGLHPAVGHLHREGDVAQRGDRQAAALGLQGALRAARRHRRRLRVLHLRPRRARRVLRHAGLPRGRRPVGHAAAARPARRDAVRADEPRPRARHVPRARRRARDPSGLRGRGRPGRILRRRDREDHPDRSAARHADRARRAARALPADVLRHAAGDARPRRRDDQGRARGAAGGAQRGRTSSSRRSGSTSARCSTSR